jgi:uncharacterized membrane protein
MLSSAHLWAVGFDSVTRASQVRDEIIRLGLGEGQAGRNLILLDTAVVVRQADGSFTLDYKPFPAVANIMACTTVGFLTGLVIGTPLTGAAVGAVLGGAGTAAAAVSSGISAEFIRDVERLMKPATSVLFVLDDVGNLDVILHGIKGLGGTVLKTNVDVERARLIQANLGAASSSAPDEAR